MSSIFNGFNIGLRALQTQKKSIDVAGHNIANANNEDYARQRALHSATNPFPMPGLQSPGGPGQLGTGVEIESIERIKDAFIEQQLRGESQKKSYWEKLHQGLERIEFTLNEPSDSSLKEAMNLFWNSLQDLSNEPSDTAARTMVKSRAESLTDTFHSLYNQLHDYKASLNSDVGTKVEEINTISSDIAALNKQITSISADGQVPNDLLDRRDALLSDLNDLVNVKGFVDNMNGLTVSIGGMRLITGSDVNELKLQTENGDGGQYWEQYENPVIFKESGERVNIKGGELKAIIELRGKETNNDEVPQIIDEYIEKLDDIAEGLVTRFNEVHKMGYDLDREQGNEFFELPDNLSDADVHAAASIGLSSTITEEDGIRKIAAGNYSDSPEVAAAWNEGAAVEDFYNIQVTEVDSDNYSVSVDSNSYTVGKNQVLVYKDGTGYSVEDKEDLSSVSKDIVFYLNGEGEANINFAANEGSGTNASALAGAIKEDQLDDLNGATVMQYYEALVSTVGVNTQKADQMVINQESLVNQLENLEKSVSGVSLDEEMANLMRYQQAYNAAAKMIMKTEELIDNLMNVIR